MIALISIGAILMYGSLIVAIYFQERENTLMVIPFLIGVIMFTYGYKSIAEKQAEIRCIKGNFKYEQQFVYRLNDTIPTDTIYVKIK